MVILTCNSCGKVHKLGSINDFTACDCGATISNSIRELIPEVEYRVVEIRHDLSQHAREGICGSFNIKF